MTSEYTNNEYWEIKTLLKNAPTIGIPHFQRGSVWNDDNIAALLESLFFDTPCGNIVLWKIPSMSSEASGNYGIPLKNDFQPEKISSFIIDGQQRTRSLLSVFCENLIEENNTVSSNDNEAETSESDDSDEEKQIPYVWAVNLAMLKEFNFLTPPPRNAQRLFVKIRDPFQQKMEYLKTVEKKKENIQDGKRINLPPEYKYQYNFVPLSFFFSYDKKENCVSVNEKLNYNIYPIDKTEISTKTIFIKYRNDADKDKFCNELKILKEKLDKILSRKLAVRTLNTSDMSDVIHTFIRINGGGRPVQEEEKTLARLVSLCPENVENPLTEGKKGTFTILKELFETIHSSKKESVGNEHFQRLKENRFGFRLFIRVFVLAANYHTGRAMGTQAMAFSAIQENEMLDSEEGKKEIPNIWSGVQDVITAVYDLLTNELNFDTLAFLPDSRSLRPVFMLLIKYPGFYKNGKIKDIYRPHFAYILLSLLLGVSDSEGDIMTFVTQLRNSPLDGCSLLRLLISPSGEYLHNTNKCGYLQEIIGFPEQANLNIFIENTIQKDCDSLMAIWEKIRNGNKSDLKTSLEERFENANALNNRYILLLYILERHLKAVDFYGDSVDNIQNENGKIRNLSSTFSAGRLIQENIESVCGQCSNPPEKQHIVPHIWLHPDSEEKKRKSNDYANNIGNITYISRELNHFETGLGKDWLNLADAAEDLRKGHIIGDKALNSYQEMIPNEKVDMSADKSYDCWVKWRRNDIAAKFCEWINEFREEAERQRLSEKIPHARRLILPLKIKNKIKFVGWDILSEAWTWKGADFSTQKCLAALHEQAKCRIELQGDCTYKLFMRKSEDKKANAASVDYSEITLAEAILERFANSLSNNSKKKETDHEKERF